MRRWLFPDGRATFTAFGNSTHWRADLSAGGLPRYCPAKEPQASGHQEADTASIRLGQSIWDAGPDGLAFSLDMKKLSWIKYFRFQGVLLLHPGLFFGILVLRSRVVSTKTQSRCRD